MKYLNCRYYQMEMNDVIVAYSDKDEVDALTEHFSDPESVQTLINGGEVVIQAPWSSMIYTVKDLPFYETT